MKLISTELKNTIPSLYAQDGIGENQLAYIKLFTPDANYIWYITECDEDENLCFGLITTLEEKELGYFSLDEIREVRGSLGLKVERDISFKPTKLKDLGFSYE